MKHLTLPKWKIWLSYLKDIVLDSENSITNGEVYVVLSKGRLLLTTEEAIYSWDDLYSNFYETFKHLGEAEIGKWNKVLVLGMGLGSIPFMLEKRFRSKADFVLVENDDAIIELAEYYSLPRLENEYEIYADDAYDFMEDCKDKFDLICVDIFVGRTVPEEFQTKEFLQRVKDCLHSGGTLIFNKLYLNKNDKDNTIDFYENVFRDLFPESEKMLTKYNMMLIGRR